MSHRLLSKNDGDGMDVIKMSLGPRTKKVGISQTLQERKRWDIPRIALRELGLKVIKSVTSEERKSGNRHFAKRVSPLKVNH